MLPSLLMAGWSPSELVSLTIRRKTVEKITEEYKANKDFYGDFARFNFCNGFESCKEYSMVDYADAPPKEKARFKKIYARLDRSYRNIAAMLGLPDTEASRYSPVESKWAYTYFKLYKTWKYHPNNTVSENDILTPLQKNNMATDDEYREYGRLFT